MIDWFGSYCGTAPTAMTWMTRWNGDIVLIAALALSGWAMARLEPPRVRAD